MQCRWPNCECKTEKGDPCKYENPDFYIQRKTMMSTHPELYAEALMQEEHEAFVDANNPEKLQPWHPITNPVDLKTLGKLVEELGELTAAASRCIIQGQNSCEPVTGKRNLQWLLEEIADVTAGIELTKERFFLPEYQIRERVEKKKKQLREWHRMA